MIRRTATLAALLLLTMLSAALAHEHGTMRMDAAPAQSTARQTHVAAPAADMVMTAEPACGGGACGTAHRGGDTCSAICAIACLAVLGDHAGLPPALVGRGPEAAGLTAMLTPTAEAPPTPPPRA